MQHFRLSPPSHAALLLLLAAPSPIPAQTAPAAPTSAPVTSTTIAQTPVIPVLRAQARLVVVDVVVLNKTGAAVHGLKQSDFVLSENNAPQAIKSFQEHADTAGDSAFIPPPHFPPGVFSNFAPTPVNDSVNVLLLDALNTPVTDQPYLRAQLLDYIKHERPGTTVAVFALASRLSMLQGFTSAPEILKTAAERPFGQASPLLRDNVAEGGNSTTAQEAFPRVGAPLPAEVLAGLQMFDEQQKAARTRDRVTLTLQAMDQLARYLANIPGRKNLIWFSGSFPLDFNPASTGTSTTSADPFVSVNSFEKEYRETTNLLARGQVAVYPIDARGIRVSPVFEVANSHPKFVEDDHQFYIENAQEHFTMERLAQDTGGQAFINTNGLSAAIAKAITLGSNYYSLSYSPSDTRWKGDLRNIHVKLKGKGYQLSYRRGYFADDPNSSTSAVLYASSPNGEPGPDPMRAAMQRGAPTPTQILFKVRVLPVSTISEEKIADRNKANIIKMKGPYRRFIIDFGALPSGFLYPESEGGVRQLAAEVVTLLYTPDGALVNSVVDSYHARLTPADYAGLQRTSISSH